MKLELNSSHEGFGMESRSKYKHWRSSEGISTYQTRSRAKPITHMNHWLLLNKVAPHSLAYWSANLWQLSMIFQMNDHGWAVLVICLLIKIMVLISKVNIFNTNILILCHRYGKGDPSVTSKMTQKWHLCYRDLELVCLCICTCCQAWHEPIYLL